MPILSTTRPLSRCIDGVRVMPHKLEGRAGGVDSDPLASSPGHRILPKALAGVMRVVLITAVTLMPLKSGVSVAVMTAQAGPRPC